MNILLLNPPFKGKFSRTSRSPAVTKGGTIYYPFWLAYAAGVLEENKFDVKLIDAPAENWTMRTVFHKLGDWQPALAIVDTSTPSIFEDVKNAEEIKKHFPSCFICLVGTHPSALPLETLRLSGAIDAVARKEFDYTLLDLAKSIAESKDLKFISGIDYRQSDEILHNEDRPLIKDLDALPFVSRVYKKHLNLKNYFFSAANYPMVMIISGRGCPYRCFFCTYPQVFHDRQYRPRSAENVVDEFHYINKYLPGVKEVGIEDDTFTTQKARTHRICSLLIKKKIKLRWYCNVRPDVDLGTMELMKRAGCRLITVGLESGSQKILDNMHKDLELDRTKRFVKDAKKAGLLIHGCIMMGNPGETKKTISESIKFAKELNCDSMQYYPLYVYPGTEAYDWAKSNGYLRTTDFSQWVTDKGYHNSVVDLPLLPAEELTGLCDKALKDYHFRAVYMLMKLKQGMKRPSEGVRTARAAFTFMRYLLRERHGKKQR